MGVGKLVSDRGGTILFGGLFQSGKKIMFEQEVCRTRFSLD